MLLDPPGARAGVGDGASGLGRRLGAGVEGDGPLGGRLCLGRGGAGGDAGLAPQLRDGLVMIARTDGFFELKRSRDRKPSFD